jgi:hypothetical protein
LIGFSLNRKPVKNQVVVFCVKILEKKIDRKSKVQSRQPNREPASQSIMFSTQQHRHNEANEGSK